MALLFPAVLPVPSHVTGFYPWIYLRKFFISTKYFSVSGLLCQLFQESLLPLIMIAGSSIWGLMRFTPITVARLSTLILLTLEFSCISCRNLPESKSKYFKSEKEEGRLRKA